MNALDEENSRRVLVAIVERAMAQVKEKAAVAQERAERAADRRAACLSFDGSHESELLRRYTTTSHRQFVRSLNEFFKVRKETEESGGELELAADESGERASDSWPPQGPESQAEDQMTEEWIEDPAIDPTDPSDPTDLAPPTDSPHPTGRFDPTDPTDRADPDDPEMTMSIAAANLRTEPKLGCAAVPSNPGMASFETESDGCDVTGPQYEPKSAVALPAETEPNNVDVPYADLERQIAGAAGCENDPNRRLVSNAVLLWTTILVLFCSSLLAGATRRTPRADGEEWRRAAAFSPILTRSASFDVAPSRRRPEGAVTNQPRATPWDHVQQPGPSTESAIQNSVLGGLRHRNSRELWRPYRARATSESRFPGRCPGLKCCFPFGAEFQIAHHRYAASRGLPFPVTSARAGPTLTDRAREGIGGRRSEVAGSITTRRASSDVAPLGRRPKGAVTNQPRATPWDHAKQPRPGPERAKQNAVDDGLQRLTSRDLWRPYRACASLESRFPGRCPGLACCFPFGAEFQIAHHRYAASRGLPFPVPCARAGPTLTDRAREGIGGGRSEVAGSILTRRASFDVARSGLRPEGTVTNQPRATPWDHVHHEHPGPVSGPKGKSQISPGQRPGTTSTTNIRAL